MSDDFGFWKEVYAFRGQCIGTANRSVAAPWGGDDPFSPSFHRQSTIPPSPGSGAGTNEEAAGGSTAIKLGEIGEHTRPRVLNETPSSHSGGVWFEVWNAFRRSQKENPMTGDTGFRRGRRKPHARARVLPLA